MGYVKTAKRYYSSGKRKYKRAQVWANTPQTPKALAWQAYKATKYLKGLVNSEMAHKDNSFSLGSAQSKIFSFVNIAQGDSASDRTGNSILVRNLYVRGTMEINTSVTGDTRICLMLVKDTQQVGDTTPSVSDIVTSSTDPDTLLATGTFGRFKVLWRKNYALTPVSGGRNVVSLSKYWKVYDHVRYNGSANTDIQKNGYYFVVITSENVNYPSVNFNARAGYHDN